MSAPDKLHILQHSLGLDEYGQGRHYRNHFVTGPGSDDWEACTALVAAGLMRDHGRHTLSVGSNCFSVTPEGINWVKSNSQTPPNLSRSRRRYLDWLHCDNGQTFGEFLRSKRIDDKEVEA